MEFKGKVAIVTGGGGGIGEQTALAFSKEGADVVVFDINTDWVEKVKSDIKSQGGQAIAVSGDVTSEDDVRNMVAQAVKAFGTVHILINNAGVGGHELIEDTPLEKWRRVIDINLTGPFICCQAVLETMKKQHYGRIVNIASAAGERIGFLGGSHYGASKAGLLNFTRLLAYEWAPYGINVNAISPGSTITPMWQRGADADPKGMALRLRYQPIGRYIQPSETAAAILFLCSDKASAITGISVPVDGGSLAGWLDVETYYECHGKPLKENK